MTSNKNLLFAFLSIILFSTILGLTAIYKMLGLSEITENMYKHPFTVSYAIQNVETQSVHIQHKMEMVMTTNNIKSMHRLHTEIAKHHQNIVDAYKLIYLRYLGDIQDIDKSYNAFIKWEAFRDSVIDMRIDKKDTKALHHKEQEATYVEVLNSLVFTLKNFAYNKAISYNENAKSSKIEAIIIISIILSIILVLSISITIYVLRNLAKSTENINRHFHLIEQNVNIAKLDTQMQLLNVTESLARLFNLEKSDVINCSTNLLFGNKEEQILEIKKIIKSGKSWNGEIYIENVAWIRAEIQCILDSQYKISGYDMIVYDITSNKQLEEVSMTDGMTGLLNRREFDKNFTQRLSLAKRENKILVFMMLDIDHFKPFNDNYGHQQGDVALKSVSNTLKETFNRPDDAVYRLGGEEFGVLFNAKDESGVESISQKVLDNIEALAIKHEHSSVCDHLTISIGVGIIHSSNTQSPDSLYVEVDSALYEAKDSGRNRYEILTI
ncbi:MAG: diguanylate cyclase (GGDEF)-like protein [Sulfurimonas sp.]|jgi:diguanylate cyclase (GGDEF)-like protein|uniref:sensor domain-containing diguanylate cyclase n=1 Tax=Sulfurimonas sp. TaxID=2022749 RepID=UPI0039E64F95